MIRGGGWNNNARNVRCAYRNQHDVENQNENLGFRLVRAHDPVRSGRPEQIDFQSRESSLAGENERAPGVLVGTR